MNRWHGVKGCQGSNSFSAAGYGFNVLYGAGFRQQQDWKICSNSKALQFADHGTDPHMQERKVWSALSGPTDAI